MKRIRAASVVPRELKNLAFKVVLDAFQLRKASELSRRIGISPQAIYYWRKVGTVPSRHIAAVLATRPDLAKVFQREARTDG